MRKTMASETIVLFSLEISDSAPNGMGTGVFRTRLGTVSCAIMLASR